MDLFEHQGKELFARYGIEVGHGVVCETAQEARAAAERFGGKAVVKVQVQIGGRGKGGGIVLASSADEAEDAARRMLEEGFKDMPVTRVLVEGRVDIAREFYVAITLDRASKRYAAMTSAEGGIDIERVAVENPAALRRVEIDPVLGLREFQVRRLVGRFPPEAQFGTADAIRKAYEMLVALDATLVEMNPLALLADGRVMPIDAKVTIDDNAMFRHPDLASLAASFPLSPVEARAKEKGLQYVKLDGEVGIVGNGAGLVMSSLDVVSQAGGRAANFLDVGGGASADMMATSLEVVLSDPDVRSVLINIFGGITRCDIVARGILEALERLDARVPLVVRLDGTNAEEGRQILAEAAHPRIAAAATMLEAAALAVELSRAEVA